MYHDGERGKTFQRRLAFLMAGKGALLATLVGRMYYLQVVEADRYRMLAEENRINMRLLPPPRGLILDRNGQPLATNRQNFRVLIIGEQTSDLEQTLTALSRIIDLSAYDMRRVRRDLKRRRSFVPVTVRENLTWEEMAQVQVNAPDLPGIVIDEGLTRHYPLASAAAHTVGYVASVAEEDLTGDPLLELPGFRIGKAGIEKVYDLPLRGSGGSSRIEVNALGRVIRELERDPGDPGETVTLTLDANLQSFAAERLGDESGSVVVMDVRDGALLTLVSHPSFDPNAFSRGLTGQEWRTLTTNERAPLINKPLQGQYAPGSTFKMVVALAALQAGIVDPEKTVRCEGHVDLGSHRYHCWKHKGHGPMTMTDALAQSCDVYFYDIARRVGVDAIAAMARQFGLGGATGLDLLDERLGLIPDRAWKQASLGESWHPGETLLAGIGQGYVLTTPLQLAVMTARMVNGGRAVSPYMVEGTAAPPTSVPLVAVSPAHLAKVREGMEAVTMTPRGTAFGARLPASLPAMAGKTGTAQVRRITLAEREAGIRPNEERPWRLRDHALFVGYAPADDPRYAVAVVVEHGGGGSSVAAPIARDVMHEVLKRHPMQAAAVPPDHEGT